MTLYPTPTAPETTGDLRYSVPILYTNYRGETAVRQITPLSLQFTSNEWHPEPQWLLKAFDVDKEVWRDFACLDIKAWGADAVEAARARGEDPNEGTEWFWRIVDSASLGNVPSDEIAALRLLCDRAAKYEATPTTPHPTEDVAALRALSEKATFGPWHHCQPFKSVAAENTIHGRVPAQRVDYVSTWPGMGTPPGHRGVIPMEGRECHVSSHDMAFIVALVNAYRSGELVHRTQLAGADTTAAPGSDGGDPLRSALEFYADPDTYIAIGFFPDRPCGDFIDDFSDEHDPGYPKPGKRAREALAALARRSTPATGGDPFVTRQIKDFHHRRLAQISAIWETEGRLDDGEISLLLRLAELAFRPVTPATGGAARLARGAVARIGRSVPRNVYWRDVPLFVAASPELAAEIVEALNRGTALALDPQPQDDTERCIACNTALKPGDRVLNDESGGVIHVDCCGPDREGYTINGEPLKDGDPIPEGYPWEPDPQPQAASEGVRDRWLDWRGAVEGFEASKQAAGKAIRQVLKDLPDDKVGTVATNVCWMVGLDHVWQHVEALRTALAAREAPNVVLALRSEADRLHAKADDLAAITPAGRGADAGGWRPIETAPKDGTRLWLYWPSAPEDDRQSVGWWHESIHGAWWMDHADSERSGPDYWMPLPAAPTAPGGA